MFVGCFWFIFVRLGRPIGKSNQEIKSWWCERAESKKKSKIRRKRKRTLNSTFWSRRWHSHKIIKLRMCCASYTEFFQTESKWCRRAIQERKKNKNIKKKIPGNSQTASRHESYDGNSSLFRLIRWEREREKKGNFFEGGFCFFRLRWRNLNRPERKKNVCAIASHELYRVSTISLVIFSVGARAIRWNNETLYGRLLSRRLRLGWVFDWGGEREREKSTTVNKH